MPPEFSAPPSPSSSPSLYGDPGNAPIPTISSTGPAYRAARARRMRKNHLAVGIIVILFVLLALGGAGAYLFTQGVFDQRPAGEPVQRVPLSDARVAAAFDEATVTVPDIAQYAYVSQDALIGPKFSDIAVDEAVSLGASGNQVTERTATATAAFRNKGVAIAVPVAIPFEYSFENETWVPGELSQEAAVATPVAAPSASVILADMDAILADYDATYYEAMAGATVAKTSSDLTTEGGTITADLTRIIREDAPDADSTNAAEQEGGTRDAEDDARDADDARIADPARDAGSDSARSTEDGAIATDSAGRVRAIGQEDGAISAGEMRTSEVTLDVIWDNDKGWKVSVRHAGAIDYQELEAPDPNAASENPTGETPLDLGDIALGGTITATGTLEAISGADAFSSGNGYIDGTANPGAGTPDTTDTGAPGTEPTAAGTDAETASTGTGEAPGTAGQNSVIAGKITDTGKGASKDADGKVQLVLRLTPPLSMNLDGKQCRFIALPVALGSNVTDDERNSLIGRSVSVKGAITENLATTWSPAGLQATDIYLK